MVWCKIDMRPSGCHFRFVLIKNYVQSCPQNDQDKCLTQLHAVQSARRNDGIGVLLFSGRNGTAPRPRLVIVLYAQLVIQYGHLGAAGHNNTFISG